MKRITDKFGRPIHDLRISVTDRCNFRCTYCMPKEVFGNDYAFLPDTALLSFPELTRMANIFAELGVKKIRLTGGEPLLRRGLPEFIRELTNIKGIEDIALTTNGLLLGTYAVELFDAGLRRLNVSLDALNPVVFRKINGRGVGPEKITQNILQAKTLGYEVKVNMVVEKGVNDTEVLPMARFFKAEGITLRFIEFMDVGNDNAWSFAKVVTKKQLITILEEAFVLEPVEATYYGEVAKRYRYKDSGTEVGFIASVSESFCSTCTRARLSSDGKLFTCLFATDGFDIRQLIRTGKSDAEILERISQIWEERSDRYSDERVEGLIETKPKINMNYIGG